MKRKKNKRNQPFPFTVIVLLALSLTVIYVTSSAGFSLKTLVKAVTPLPQNPSQQQGTFDLLSPTPLPISPTPIKFRFVTPTVIMQASNNTNTASPVTPQGLVTGGPASPSDPFYCIDDEDPDGCDDNTAFHVPKGAGGVGGTCGTIMENAHKIVASLPQDIKAFRDRLNPAVTTACHNTGTYSSGYISTFFVIDAFNLSGFMELSKNHVNNVTGTSLLSWWQAQPAGYKFVPYTPTVLQQHASGQQNLTGCVVFINMPSGGVHVGIFNVLEQVNTNGDGVLSILQSGASFYLDRFPVAGWDVQSNVKPFHQTAISGVAGFGCHT